MRTPYIPDISRNLRRNSITFRRYIQPIRLKKLNYFFALRSDDDNALPISLEPFHALIKRCASALTRCLLTIPGHS